MPRSASPRTLAAMTLTTPTAAREELPGSGRSFEVRTFGCQMNAHDSERMAGSLQAAGYHEAEPGTEADVIVINTCAVRENADNKLYGTLGHLAERKREHPGLQIAVGGCLAQKDQSTIVDKAPWVDVVFGTHNMGSLPTLLERSRHNPAGRGGNPGGPRGLPLDAPSQAGKTLIPAGSVFRWGVTTPARSASCRACVAKKKTAGPVTSSGKSRLWWTKAPLK